MEFIYMGVSVFSIARIIESLGCELSPCTQEEVELIESQACMKLPDVYRDFLILMGKGAGQFMAGSSVFYGEVLDINGGAKELLVENGVDELPHNAYVFWMHQGYQFAFFLVDEGSDPEVYFYYEGQGEFEKTSLHFTDFLELQTRYLKGR